MRCKCCNGILSADDERWDFRTRKLNVLCAKCLSYSSETVIGLDTYAEGALGSDILERLADRILQKDSDKEFLETEEWQK